MAKVRALHDVLNSKLAQFSVVHEELSIGEFMVTAYGCHLCKQFIHAKQIRFEDKLQVIASSAGFPYSIEIYEGRSANSTDKPSGTRVAASFCQN